MNDYTIMTEFENGKAGKTTYQRIISTLGMGGEKYMGRPWTDGGMPQVQALMGMLKDIYTKKGQPIKKMVALYDGEPVLGV